MIRKLRLRWLKRKARGAILRVRAIANSYDCGHAMLLNFSGSYVHACEYADYLFDEIAKLDPDCPKQRYLR